MCKSRQDQAELIATARAELKVDGDCPEGMIISGVRIGDELSKRDDLKG